MDLSREAEAGHTTARAHAASGMVLLTLASAQFLMTLDSSVMNVSIATVAKDVGTTVLAVIALIALFFSRRIPTKQPSAAPASLMAAVYSGPLRTPEATG